jgi:hypothetical protein
MDSILRWWFKTPAGGPPRVVKAFAFNHGDPALGWHAGVRVDPESWAGRGWEDDVALQTGFSDFRVEIRIMDNQKKRRILLYPGNDYDPSFPQPARRIVISARMMPRPGTGAACMDVTRRVQKYIGNTLRNVHDMFPFDDHEDNAERFSHLRIIDLAFSVTDVPLERP